MKSLPANTLNRRNDRKLFHGNSPKTDPAEDSYSTPTQTYSSIDQKEMETYIPITKDTRIADIQKNFRDTFSYLDLQFFKSPTAYNNLLLVKHFYSPEQTIGKIALLKKEMPIVVNGSMTVDELIQQFKQAYGLNAQVLRKSANLWLEISLTNNWSLERQNNHGKEISIQ